MELTVEQERLIKAGQAVPVSVCGAPCVVVRKDIYDRAQEVDYSPWSKQEMDLLASETADLLAADGLDEMEAP